jgi:hypothetical protein
MKCALCAPETFSQQVLPDTRALGAYKPRGSGRERQSSGSTAVAQGKRSTQQTSWSTEGDVRGLGGLVPVTSQAQAAAVSKGSHSSELMIMGGNYFDLPGARAQGDVPSPEVGKSARNAVPTPKEPTPGAEDDTDKQLHVRCGEKGQGHKGSDRTGFVTNFVYAPAQSGLSVSGGDNVLSFIDSMLDRNKGLLASYGASSASSRARMTSAGVS